jgi:2-keto-4-pentenoate hydratase/2-oxohepta-3-ene-1,7-dioic acid hydratase in catechol pathway
LRIVRFSYHGDATYGVLEGDVIKGYRGSPFTSTKTGRAIFSPNGLTYKIEDVILLAPCEPSKIVCLGLNYHKHIEEIGFKRPDTPLLFLKPPSSIINPDEFVIRPDLPVKGHIDYEGEVGVVIGVKARDVEEEQASKYILGFTCVNDVTARDVQKKDGQWTRSKSYDTFCPIGPCIGTEGDPLDIKIETRINGQVLQSSSTARLIFSIPLLISFISGVMTLMPGDVISTGTPEGIGQMNPGDVVEITASGVGTLRHYVKDKGTG